MIDNQTVTASARPKTITNQRAVRRKRNHILRNTAYAVIMLGSVAVIAKFAADRFQQQSVANEQAQAGNSTDMGVGSISQQTDKGRCELVKFDNYTGRTLENSRHCETTVVRDARGVPVPVGTVHRLDSISKSFLGDNR